MSETNRIRHRAFTRVDVAAALSLRASAGPPVIAQARARGASRSVIAVALVTVVVMVVSCACASTSTAPVATAKTTSLRESAPTVEEVRNLTYTGLGELFGPVTLVNGRWTGSPVPAGTASRPIVEIASNVRVIGDLDRDGDDEASVLLTYSAGGSGVFSFVAVVTRESGRPRNVATTALPDRVQVRSIRVDGGQLVLNAVQGGPNDAACCPGELVDWRWRLEDGRLSSPGAVPTGRLALATLAGTVWVLLQPDLNAAAESPPSVTLAYDAGRFTGSSGCNRYFAGVEGGASPGAVKVGPLGGTRMACPEPITSVEGRFLEQLGAVRTFGFSAGRLALSYTAADGSAGTLLFDATNRKEQ